MTSTAQLKPTNQHFSVDPDGNEVFDLTFASEALGMPAADGYGWAQFEFCDQVGDSDVCQGNRYSIMTNMYERAVVWEVEALRLASRRPASPHCTNLLDEFTIPGRFRRFPRVLRYARTRRLSERARRGTGTGETAFPLPLVKRIVLHLFRGIAHGHGHDIVHTDIKHDNIFFPLLRPRMTSKRV